MGSFPNSSPVGWRDPVGECGSTIVWRSWVERFPNLDAVCWGKAVREMSVRRTTIVPVKVRVGNTKIHRGREAATMPIGGRREW